MEFLQPLQVEEEKDILRRVQRKEEEAISILIERNMRLVAYVANQYPIPGLDPEDAISIGVIGLIKAVHTFDIEKNVKFATYATRCIQNELFMHLRKTKNKPFNIYLNEVISRDVAGNELTVLDTIISDEETIDVTLERKDDVHTLYALVEALPMKEKLVIEYRYGINRERKKQEDIALECDISQSYVSRIEKRAIRKLREGYRQLMH